MQSKPKSNSTITHAVDMNTQVVTFNVKGCEPVVFDLNKCHDDVAQRAFIHGMIQRISDAAAISRNADTGLPATPEDKRARMAALVAHYESGTAEWSRKVAAGERETGGLALRAIAAIQGVAVDIMRARVKAMAEKRGITEKAYLNSVSASAAVQAKMAELRGPAVIDADEAMKELEELGA